VAYASRASAATSSTVANCLDTQEQAFLTDINNYRASKGLKKLVATRSLNAASYYHSLDMGVHKYFSHTGSDGSTPWARMAAQGYSYSTYKGENIAAGYSTAGAGFNGWKASPGHNANRLNPNFKPIGIGRAGVSGSPYTT